MSALPSRVLNSYDLLKAFAVLTMVIDHVGLYFFPDVVWFRVIGRLSAPVWFFLIGYARTRDIPPVLWQGALVVSVSSFLTSGRFHGFGVLWSIMLLRLGIDPLMRWVGGNVARLWGVLLLCAALSNVTGRVFEYGTLAVMLTILGYYVRNAQTYSIAAFAGPVALVTLLSYMVRQMTWFPFDVWQCAWLICMSVPLGVLLVSFRPVAFPRLSFGQPLNAILHLCGRYSLQIYVGHFVALQWISFVLVFMALPDQQSAVQSVSPPFCQYSFETP